MRFIKPKSFGEKDFDKIKNAYGDMYDILSQDKMAQEEFPELAKAAKSLRLYGFLNVALKNFKAHGLMDEKIYSELSKKLYDKTEKRANEGFKGIEKYILSEEKKKELPKTAAAILIVFGVACIILTGANITANVIGNVSPKNSGILGGLLVLLGLTIFLITKKKHKK